MNERERLIELLDTYHVDYGAAVSFLTDQECEDIADLLLANGVTVREWISVKDRKPDFEWVDAKADDFDLYACLATIKNVRARNGRYVGKAWYDGERFIDSDFVDITYNVTHWMPLPKPPKGEA